MSNQTADRAAWREVMVGHLAKEKAHTRAGDALAAERRALPQLIVDQKYTFTTTSGPATLDDLFGEHSQLIIIHFMFGADWEEGCPSCSYWADSYNGVDFHLANRDTAFVAVSTASVDQIETYRKRMEWTFPWVSSAGTMFNSDFGVSPASAGDEWEYNFAPAPRVDEMPGLSVFTRSPDGTIALTYQAFARGLESFNSCYALLDLTAAGRNEQDLSNTMAWLQRQH